MKIKEGFIVRTVAGSNIVLPLGSQKVEFDGIMTINETGLFLWSLLEKGAEREELLDAILNEYEVTRELATRDVDRFIEKLSGAGILE